MLIRRRDGAVRVRTPAKVNLFLEVLGRRPDGYHDLATLMVTVGLYDSLEIGTRPPTARSRLSCDRPACRTGHGQPRCAARRSLLRLRYGVDVRRGGPRCAQAHPHGGRAGRRLVRRGGHAGGTQPPVAAGSVSDALGESRCGTGQRRAVLLPRPRPPGVPAAGRSSSRCRLAGRSTWCWPARRSGLSTASVFAAPTVPGRRPMAPPRGRPAAGDVERLGRALHNRLQAPAIGLCPGGGPG